MVRYKKGDLPKILILVVLIIGVFWFSFSYLLNSGKTSATSTRRVVAQSTPRTPLGSGGSPELFAPRSNSTSELLSRAQRAFDPFRPIVTMEVVHTASSTPSATPTPTPPSRSGSLPSSPQEGPPLRLSGIVSGKIPTAVMKDEDGNYQAASVGDTLPSGWQVTKISGRTVILKKDKLSYTLTFMKEKEPTTQPVGLRQ